MNEPLITMRGLRKSFGRHSVLAGVDLDVPRGSITGFLGLNGAGKSTTIRILLGLLMPDGGECRVAGLDPRTDPIAVRQRVGYMAENQTMFGWMRVGELMHWCAAFYPTWNAALADQLREQMGLAADQKVGTLSKGQTSKLALLLSLAHEPELVILDDPVLGLDPLARRDFLRDVIGQLQARNVTVFFSSHLLYEIEPICDRVAILHDGRILTAGGVDELRGRVKRVELRLNAAGWLPDVPTLLDVQRQDDQWALTVADVEAARPALSAISPNGLAVVDLNLDEIFEAYVAGRPAVGATS